MNPPTEQDAGAEVWPPDDQHPFDEETSRRQIEGLLKLLAPAPKRVLELGCGAGRVLVPLAEAGHEVVGIERDQDALAQCRTGLDQAGLSAQLREGDLDNQDAWPAESFDAVILVGNTLMTIVEIERAISLLTRATSSLRAGGMVIVDDVPGQFWPELTEGNWQSGISPDGGAQLVWHTTDTVFALRYGDAVDPDDWTLKSSDQLHRLWTDGALMLAAREAALSAPERADDACLLVMRRTT